MASLFSIDPGVSLTFVINKDDFSVGRSSQSDGMIESNEAVKGISKIHFRVLRDPASPSTYSLLDLSSNGTFVNSVLVKDAKCPLTSGSEIEIGRSKKSGIRFVLLASSLLRILSAIQIRNTQPTRRIAALSKGQRTHR